jgi:enoyl-CoA hydratase/carnithine racemase
MKTEINEKNAVLLEQHGSTAVLRLNRPDVRNAINDDMRAEMIGLIDQIERDSSIRALVLTGNGSAFCAGGDVRAMRERLAADPADIAMNGWRRQQRTHHLISVLHGLNKPTIAAVNGAATGLGCDLALCCDFVIAADSAKMAMTYVQRGLIPDGGGMYFLPRRTGLARAKELIFSGRTVAPDEALALGMADYRASDAGLMQAALDLAGSFAEGAVSAIALAKGILDRTFESTPEEVFAAGSQAQAICYSSREHKASVAEFLAKSAAKAALAPANEGKPQ